MGNHDYFTDGEALVSALEAAGLTVLRNRGVELHRDGARPSTWPASTTPGRAGTTWRARWRRGRRECPPCCWRTTRLLFPEAAERGVDLVLSGHTHGGQVAVPLFARKLNLARLMTRFTTGVYQSGDATLYVNRGLGTTGPPVRLAAARDRGVHAGSVQLAARARALGPVRRAHLRSLRRPITSGV